VVHYFLCILVVRIKTPLYYDTVYYLKEQNAEHKGRNNNSESREIFSQLLQFEVKRAFDVLFEFQCPLNQSMLSSKPYCTHDCLSKTVLNIRMT